MSRFYNIRWKLSDNEEIRKTVKNFNAKITRLEKKYDKLIETETDRDKKQQLTNEKNALPKRQSTKQFKKLVDTRQDLKRELNALKRFSKKGSEDIVTVPGNEYNLKTTKWQKNEMSRRVGIINRKRKERYQEAYDTALEYRGEKLGYTQGQLGMGSVDEMQLQPMNAFTPSMTRTSLNKKFDVIMEESQSSFWNKQELIMKENFKEALLTTFRKGDIKNVLQSIDDMDFKDFYSKFKSQVGKFEDVYFPDDDQYDQYLELIKSTWLPEVEPGRK